MKSSRDHLEKNKWRIKPIPFNDPYAMIETNWGAVIGTFLFIGGLFAGIKNGALFAISILGLIFGLLSILYRARSVRKNWVQVSAQCVDKEWNNVLGAAGQSGGVRLIWSFQLLCELELDGNRYTVTPSYWSTFISERRLQQFLGRIILPDGTCQLWVNPENPLQAELMAHDITEFLLH
jgi:hypothetical protein